MNLKHCKSKRSKVKQHGLLGSNENGNFIKAEAEGKGSGEEKEVKIDLLKTPFINITWKVEKDLSGIVENSKKGHDYAARVFVIKKTGSTALSNRAINYVFSSNNEVGKIGLAHTQKSQLIMYYLQQKIILITG